MCPRLLLAVLWPLGRLNLLDHSGRISGNDGQFWHILGDYAALAPPDLIVAKTWSAHPTEIADLFGRRLVVASETERNQRLRVGFVKQATGDARLKGRYMRRDFFEFDRQFKIILVTNNRPVVDELTHATWRRLKLVPFANVVPDEKQDKQLPQKLWKERSGILAWLVRGCLSWQRDGMVTPAEVVAATGEYQRESNLIGQFVEECLSFAPEFWTRSSRLSHGLEMWCRENGYEPNIRNLWQHLRQKQCEQKQTRDGRGWSGVSIVTDAEARDA